MHSIKLDDPDSGAIVPVIAVITIVLLGIVIPYAAKIAGIERSATTTLAFSAAVDRIGLASYSVGRATTTGSAGRIVPPAPEGGEIPSSVSTIKNDRFGTPYLYCTATNYSSPAEPLFALVSGGTNEVVETGCAEALAGVSTGDDIVRSTSAYEASVTPYQVDPQIATLNGMWRSRCASTGVIQNLPSGSRCSDFTSVWGNFISQNGGLLP
ncbi:hypothetical protein [Nisaea sediminum]|jgi:hypothetical protein|uniref:hypothetical protein n=2 Tax=Pseudomonadota TaxID=1224 RepID=UPI001865F2A3|nr:hypothetical protein [Nisaea sediminum]